jgi:hypothetical protein
MLREILSSIARRADWSALPLAMRTARLGVAVFTEGGGPAPLPHCQSRRPEPST